MFIERHENLSSTSVHSSKNQNDYLGGEGGGGDYVLLDQSESAFKTCLIIFCPKLAVFTDSNIANDAECAVKIKKCNDPPYVPGGNGFSMW